MRRRRRIRECPRRSRPRPHFFKIIVKASLASGELIIPEEFTRQHAKKIADVAVLKVPTGREWGVEVKKVNGSVRFQNGWRGFMEYYSISIGHFILFRYDGNSTFSVFIFNQGACEIDYPSDTGDDLEEESKLKTNCLNLVKKEPEEEDPVKPLDSFPSFQPLPSSAEEILDKAVEQRITKRGRPRKIRSSEDHVEPLDAFRSFLPLPSSAEEVVGKAQELRIRKRGRPRKNSARKHPELRELGDGSGLIKIKTESTIFPSFQPLPSSAEEVLDKSQETRITKRGRPRGSCSAQKQTRNRKHQEVTESGDGSILNGIKSESPSSPSPLPLPSSAEEVLDKSQEIRITKRGRPRGSCSSVKQRINRKHQELSELGDGSGLNGSEGKNPIFDAETEKEVVEVSSDNTNNEISMSTSTDSYSLSMDDDAQNQNTDADNSLPSVPLPSYGDVGLQLNWSERSPSANATQEVESNCLEQECISKEFTARNSTSAAEPDAGNHLDSSLTKDEVNVSIPSSSQRYIETARKRLVTFQQREKTIYSAQNYKTENHSVMIIMKPSYVDKGVVLNFPKDFAKKYLSHGLHNVKVSVSDGRTWMVRCSLNQRKAMISGGWRKFVRDNKLKVGDCCVFELSKAEGMELKISIFRVVDEAEPELKQNK